MQKRRPPIEARRHAWRRVLSFHSPVTRRYWLGSNLRRAAFHLAYGLGNLGMYVGLVMVSIDRIERSPDSPPRADCRRVLRAESGASD